MFERNVKRVRNPEHNAVTSVCAAKHRIETVMSKPRSRFVIFIDAVIATAEELAAVRTGSVSDAAFRFLAQLNNKDFLLTAMMCDATDEGMLLKQFMDDAELDVGELNRKIEEFVDRIQFLFVEGHTKDAGDTHVAIKLLRHRRIIHLRDGKPKAFGGFEVKQNSMQSCLERLTCWVSLSTEAGWAEFPNFTICASFGVFDLMGKGMNEKSKQNQEATTQNKSIARLAKFSAWIFRYWKLQSKMSNPSLCRSM